ncbi:MAG: Fe-S cluster assembly protein SufD [Acidocella sp. 20-57-95]|nr:MAG: Fe-S cluster assembly protein SufD [Acidocella sp. 20-57-95]OYV59031.1 MAG: Fe-S cluster assembly protein SufD [Acidocella sp. 21-58-7]HQT65590.1 Fe-S cluster assembly protein SufD [Acidocella sp.]
MTALPTRKLEAWRYTELKSLAAISFAEPKPAKISAPLPDLGLPRIVFVNGSFNAALSNAPDFVGPFAKVLDDSALPLVQINAANAQDGITIDIPAGIDAGAIMLISYANAAEPIAFHPRHRIVLGTNATLTIIEVALGQGVYWHNPVTDITLQEGATLGHYRLQDESAEAFHLATIRADIAEKAAYESFSLVVGGKLSRAEFHTNLNGPNASTHLNAAQLLRGRQHADFTSVVGHKAPNCASRQTVKSVLFDHARGVFQGRIEVAQIAQKTDGYQMNQALLLSPHAEIDIKPELEIFADDVKCSHGATIGALDPEQIFYLRSRGIPEDQARAMLIRAFLTEALEPVTHEAARTFLEDAIETWWARK